MSSLHIYFRARIIILFFLLNIIAIFLCRYGIGTSYFTIKGFIAGDIYIVLFFYFPRSLFFLENQFFIDIYRF